jgi:hypothetical protein
MFTLSNLENCGLIRNPESKNVHATLKKSLNLWDGKADESNPNDISFTYSGY